jgi:hypothetical protein
VCEGITDEDSQILTATCVYVSQPTFSGRANKSQLVYLIIVVASGKAAVPVISLAMIAAVYGLQVSLPA